MNTALFKRKGGILLDVGCGEGKNPGFVGLDRQRLPGVDIVHDLERFPYPIPESICLSITASHIVEHIKPWLFIPMMNELWRIMKPGGRLAIAHPYGVNELYVQDPTHCNPCNENTWLYFDPRHIAYKFYKPKPWLLDKGFPVWDKDGIMEVLFKKPEKGEKYESYKG